MFKRPQVDVKISHRTLHGPDGMIGRAVGIHLGSRERRTAPRAVPGVRMGKNGSLYAIEFFVGQGPSGVRIKRVRGSMRVSGQMQLQHRFLPQADSPSILSSEKNLSGEV